MYAGRLAEYVRQSEERDSRTERLWRARKMGLLNESGAWHVRTAARANTADGDGEMNPQREMRWLLCARENRFRMRLLTAPNLHFDSHELAAKERDFHSAPVSSEPVASLGHQVRSAQLRTV